MYAKQFFFENYKQNENIDFYKINSAIENDTFTEAGLSVLNKDINLMEFLQSDELIYSNQILCDKIIIDVYNNTTITEIKKLIEQSYIGFLETDKKGASAWRQFYDGSYLTIIGEYTYNFLDKIGEIFVAKYLKSLAGLVKNPNNNKLIDKLLSISIKEKDIIIKEKQLIDISNQLIGIDNFCEDYVRLTTEILEVALAFIIGHEYGHHFFEHLKNNDIQIENNIINFHEEYKVNIVGELNENCIMELDSDKFGVLFVNEFLRCYKDRGISILQIYGIVVSMIFISMESKNLVYNSDTHPSLKNRYCMILIHIRRLFGKDIEKQVSEMINWFCEDTKYYLWDSIWWK